MGSIIFLIFLPGILGSQLFLNGETVWPPTPLEAKFGYQRIEKLADPAVTFGDPIDSVLCFDVYKPLLRDLSDIASGNAGAPRRIFHPFGYDWRIDLREIATNIAVRIDALPSSDKDEICFVGHSMGCLVNRLILESGVFDDRSWFRSVRSFAALAGPHLGSPTALIRAMGLEGSTGLSGPDIKNLGANPRYPALYQLLPAPGLAVVLNTKGDQLKELDLYAAAVSKRLGLNTTNLNKAAAVHKILSKNKRPSHVEYIYLAGSGNDTWVRVDLKGAQALPRKGKEVGDGTVPLWSAVSPVRVHHAAPAAHEDVFRSEQIRTLMYFSLGARPAAAAFMSEGQKPLVTIFPTHPIYGLGKPVDLMLAPVMPTHSIQGELVVEFNDGEGAVAFQPLARQPLSYNGVQIEQLRVRLNSLPTVGFYRVRFEGSHDMSLNGAAMFGVSDAGGPTGAP